MMGMSFTEILIILALALLLFGPDELPKMAKTLGKGLRELRKATDDIKSTLESEMNKLDDEPKPGPLGTPMMLPPVIDTSDPGAARAAARFAAAGKPAPTADGSDSPAAAPVLPLLPVVPAPASEAAERPAVPAFKLGAPLGAVSRELAASPAQVTAPLALPAALPSASSVGSTSTASTSAAATAAAERPAESARADEPSATPGGGAT